MRDICEFVFETHLFTEKYEYVVWLVLKVHRKIILFGSLFTNHN